MSVVGPYQTSHLNFWISDVEGRAEEATSPFDFHKWPIADLSDVCVGGQPKRAIEGGLAAQLFALLALELNSF